MTLVLVGIGAGLVSALLFAVVITGSPLGIVLSYAAPLPVFIAAMGWRHRAGLVALGAGALALGVALKYSAGMAYAIGVALPAWWIAYLALLGRSETDNSGQETTQWYPIGRLLMWIAVTSALVTLAGAVAISGTHEGYLEAMRKTLGLVLGSGLKQGAGPAVPGDLDLDQLSGILAAFVPFVAGASFVPMIAGNLWLAAKVVKMSGRLVRPWPDMASTVLPREAALALVAASLGYLVLPGFAGLACAALSGALVTAFFLTGLAAIHAMTWGKSWRQAALAALYFSVFVILTLALPVLAVFGLADTLFNLRDRANLPATPPSTPTTP
jgi:hypothetical protein